MFQINMREKSNTSRENNNFLIIKMLRNKAMK